MRHFIFLCISLLTLSPSFVFGNTSDDVAKLQGIKAQEMSKTVTPQDRTTYFSHDISGRLSQAKKLAGAKGKYTKAIYTWTEDGASVIMKVLSLKASRDEGYRAGQYAFDNTQQNVSRNYHEQENWRIIFLEPGLQTDT
ncbi:hypothetical protein GGU11DRAFT_371366 [Lentinula aff. detonsa]|nr:hypothetical protein GGU11DRAFT_371366 [Lentinula aff. detonsa]